VYQDLNILIIVDIDDNIGNLEYLLGYKYILEERFEQIEVYKEKFPLLFFLIKLFLLGKEKVWMVFFQIYKLDEQYLASLRS